MKKDPQNISLQELKYKSMFQSLVANIPGAVYRCANNPEWTMEFISDYIEELTGFPAADFIENTKRTYASIIHPDDIEHVDKAVQDGIRADGTFTIHYRIVRADGTHRWVYERGRSVHGKDGRVLWLDGAILDDTQRKQAEDDLHKSKGIVEQKAEDLEQLNKLMIGREVKMADLKKEIDALLTATGKPAKYHK